MIGQGQARPRASTTWGSRSVLIWLKLRMLSLHSGRTSVVTSNCSVCTARNPPQGVETQMKTKVFLALIFSGAVGCVANGTEGANNLAPAVAAPAVAAPR